MKKLLKRPTANTSSTAKQRPGQFKPSGLPHETVYEMYRDLGPGRSLRRLEEAVRLRWPANAVSIGTLSNWATQDGWKKRIEEYEKGISQGQDTQTSVPVSLGMVDDVAVLEQAASQALAAVLRSTSVAVRNPSDVKALVDTANKALELAAKLKADRTGVATSEEIAAFGAKLLQRVDEARRKDFVVCAKAAAEAACAEAGTTNLVAVLKKTAAALGMRVDDEGKFYDLEKPTEETSSVVASGVVVDTTVAVAVGNVAGVKRTAEEERHQAEVGEELDIDDVMKQLRGD